MIFLFVLFSVLTSQPLLDSPGLLRLCSNQWLFLSSPDLDISKTARLLLWVSFAYTEKSGVYLSVYFHPSLDYDERKK